MSINILRHERGLTRLQNRLRAYGVRTKRMPQYKCAYDLETDHGQRIEFKIGREMNSRGSRIFAWNLHRHNVPFDASKCDVLVLEGEGWKTIVLAARSFHGSRRVSVPRFPKHRDAVKIPDLGIGAIVLAERTK